jgi:multiple sugar transport system substrate-binding protein
MKSLSVFPLALILALALKGCPSSETGASDSSQLALDRTVLKIAYSYDGFEGKMGELIGGYASEDRSVSVESIRIPSDRYDETLNMLFSSGEGPDVFEIGSNWIHTYLANSWLTNLENEVDDEFKAKFPQWAIDETWEITSVNSIYALPLDLITVRLIYNKDIFLSSGLDPEKPPGTLEEMRECANSIRKSGIGSKQYGFALPGGDERLCFEQLMEAANSYSGAYFYDYNAMRYDLTVYSPWLQAIIDMKNDDSLFPGENGLRNYTALEQFSEGHIGMMYATSRTAYILHNQLPVGFEWGVAMPPVLFDDSSGKLIVSPSSYFAVSSKSMDKQKAAGLWKRLFSEEVAGELYRNGEIIPAISGITDNPAYEPDIPNFNDFFPGESEEIHRLTPLKINDWNRFQIYLDVIETGRFDSLAEESVKLNDDMENSYNVSNN